ncbi:hypothetical protein HKX48_009549 [Thoreauomyces humboldtii]|nr:hypothetical protein HKX48_009549 [Thoreauomyces humboldtii]
MVDQSSRTLWSPYIRFRNAILSAVLVMGTLSWAILTSVDRSNWKLKEPPKTTAHHFARIQERTIRLPMPGGNRSEAIVAEQYSKFRCFGDENLIQEFTERACVFENICYNLPSGQFRFYRRPNSVPKPLFFDEVERELFDFHSKVGTAGLVAILHDTPISQGTWSPTVHPGAYPNSGAPEKVVTLKGLHMLFATWPPDDNLGHLLWEDLLGAFAATVRLNIRDDNAVPIWIRGDLPDRLLWRKFIAGFFPAVTSHSIVTLKDYVHAHSTALTEDICFEELLAGGNIRRFIRSAQHHNIGHEPILLEFRDRVLRNHRIVPEILPKQHRIVVSHKRAASSGRSFANENEMVEFLRQAWPTVQLDVVCFSDLSITEQLHVFTNTTILITHSGGGSAMLPFLPDGAHAIILDYLAGGGGPVIDNDVPGHSVSMEAALWNYWPHVKKLYYQIYSPDELRVDNPIEAAFENMAS